MITDRREIFARLRSFDPQALTGAAREQAVLSLLRGSFGSAADVHRHLARRECRIPEPNTPEVDLELARDCLKNVFSFYGERHELGPDIDWERNPGTDHWGHDLNRFHYLPHLVLASRETRDEVFVRKGAALVLDWVDQNEVTGSWLWSSAPEHQDWHGRKQISPYVWHSYLNIAIHLIHWSAWLEELVPFWTPPELLRVLKSMHDQLAYLELAIPTMHNNWIVIGCWGMTMTASRLPELRDQDRFLDYALAGLSREVDRQILPDGVQFELTQHYHLGVTRWFCQSVAAAQAAGCQVPENLERITVGMLDYLMHTVTPDGKQVAFNDSDPNCGQAVLKLLTEQGRHHHRPDWIHVGTGGREGAPSAMLSHAFEYGGVYILRNGWETDSVYLAFDGGPAGESHRHWDKLSFWLSAYGRSLIVDPGRYLYDAHNPYSPYLRSTRAHSTITVDDEDQADAFFPETWKPGERLSGNRWEIGEDVQIVGARHSLGYGQDGHIHVEHQRTIFSFQQNVFLVLDRLIGEGIHHVDSRLQFAPGDLATDGAVWHTLFEDANLAVLPFADVPATVAMKKGELDPVSGWYSDGVNLIEPSPTLVMHLAAELPLRAGFLLVPYRGTVHPTLDLELDEHGVSFAIGGVKRTIPLAKN